MSDVPRDPELEHLFELYGEVLKAQLRVALPGKITEYDATKQRGSVKVLVKDSHVDAAQKRVATSVPEIHGVPIMQLGPPRGRITFPIAVGDLCWVMFASSSIVQFLLKGGEVDPKSDRHLDINDAVALVGLHSFASIPTTAPTDAVVVHAGDGVKVKLGGPSGTESTLMADTLKTAIDALTAGIKAGLVAAGNTSVGGAAIGLAFDTILSAFDTAYAAAKTLKTEVK